MRTLSCCHATDGDTHDGSGLRPTLMPISWCCCATLSLMVHNQPIIIASVNMQKQNAVTHALLNSDCNTNIFLIQELWYDRIGTACKDTAWQGIDVLGSVASTSWETLYVTWWLTWG